MHVQRALIKFHNCQVNYQWILVLPFPSILHSFFRNFLRHKLLARTTFGINIIILINIICLLNGEVETSVSIKSYYYQYEKLPLPILNSSFTVLGESY